MNTDVYSQISTNASRVRIRRMESVVIIVTATILMALTHVCACSDTVETHTSCASVSHLHNCIHKPLNFRDLFNNPPPPPLGAK